ncbi:MAG: N-acetylmuramoyl-L-alanine amidase family protein, partial [Candidatus Hinthialibacter sp.]
KKYSPYLQLTIPCRSQVDVKGLAHHVWDDMVTIDLPLRAPNHNCIPPTEEIRRFCDPDGHDGRVVILDAGHGAFDSGAVPRYAKRPFLLEKDVALDLAKRMERMFKQHPKIKVFLTRYGDYLPVPFGLKGRTRTEYKNESLRYRVQLAKEYLGDVYLSLHLNAPPSYSRSAHQRARGYEIYYLGERHAENLINNPDVVELTNLGVEEKKPNDQHSGLFLELLKENIPQASLELAGHVTAEMRRIPWLEMRDPAMKSNRFTVIKQLLMPSVLVEFMFITNPTEHEQVRSSGNRAKLAGSIYKAVCKFLFDPSAPIQLAAADVKSIQKTAIQNSA